MLCLPDALCWHIGGSVETFSEFFPAGNETDELDESALTYSVLRCKRGLTVPGSFLLVVVHLYSLPSPRDGCLV